MRREDIEKRVRDAIAETFGTILVNGGTTITDAVLDAMRGDPGHDATAAVVPPMGDRTEALRIWNGMIDAVKAGA